MKNLLPGLCCLLLVSCGQFLGFSPLPEYDLGAVAEVRIRLSADSLRKLYDSVREDDDAPCIIEADGRRRQARIQIRGNVSRMLRPKNFTVRILEGGFETEYAFDSSGASIKNALAMYAYRLAGLPAPMTEPAAFFINDDYLGCYTRLSMYSRRNLPAYSGQAGELFKINIRNMGSDMPLHDLSEKKFPDDDDFSSLDRLLASAAYLDGEDWESWVADNVDVDRFVRYLVVHDFLGVYDTSHSNYYLYNHGRFMMLPWDNELSMDKPSALRGDTVLTRKLMEVEEVSEEYDHLMESLFLDPGPENIFSKVQDEANRLFLLIEKAVLCDENVGLDAAELAAQNQAIRDFLAGRPAEFP